MSKKKHGNSGEVRGNGGKNVEREDPEKNDGSMDLDAVSPDEIEKILKSPPAGGEAGAKASADASAEKDAPKKAEDDAAGAEKARLAELGKKAAERDEFYDLLLRSKADFDNYKKRISREQENFETDTVASFLKQILPVLDDFERFVKAGSGGGRSEGESALYEGAKAIYAKLWKILADAGLGRMDALAKPFDVFRHEALFSEESSKYEQPSVLEVIEEGYEFRGQVLRHAKVKISRPPAKKEADQNPASDTAKQN